MRAHLVAVALAAMACGRVDFERRAGSADANDTDAEAEVDAAGVCANLFRPLGSAPHRYLFITAPAPWVDARTACEGYGPGHGLALPTTDMERLTLSGAAQSLTSGRWWIGGSDLAIEGTWADVAGAPITYLPWGEFEPNDFNGEDCLDLMADAAEGANRVGKFDDLACTGAHAYICACTL